MNKSEIGINAGKVWETIHQHGEMSFKEIKKLTGLNDKKLLMAMGWLARENKIFQRNLFQQDWLIRIYENDHFFG